MDPEINLKAAVSNLYKAFAKYPANPNMDGSPMYADNLDQWNRDLTCKPLHELSGDDLRIFYFKAMTTWGDVADFKHFLPRIFELLTQYDLDIDEWPALSKLNYGKWRIWPEPEQAAVEEYLLAFWQYLLRSFDYKAEAHFSDYFVAIANVYPRFRTLLDLWEAAFPQALVHLVNFVECNSKAVLQRQTLDSIYKLEVAGRYFYKWLTTEAMLAKLEAAFFETTDEEFAQKVSIVIQLIEGHRNKLLNS
ncbi:hypothetical protein [Hymenobacter cavernae]|uniref:Uncharacterized protein n=1 Tax=Hymenobacter cavernae TaxID=2044852 RepID=A0ABQ1UHR8_9BACT|nr:hypothetical protein [Hymenobacter cavernae]GGF19176.1 hypothetical protein GCM10011383_33380 [Hymenobacter cavernae]